MATQIKVRQNKSRKIGAKRKAAKTGLQLVHEYRARQRDCKYGMPQDVDRRRRLEGDTAAWLRHYMPETFYAPFAKIHTDYITDLDYILANGGWKAIAMPRGSGKTNIALAFALKSALVGKLNYLIFISAKAADARANIHSLKSWLLHNDRLAADYPEICEPIRHTKGIPQSMKTLTANGQPVVMAWTANQIVLPNSAMADGTLSPGGSVVIECEGITGSLRGKKHDRPDGKTVRPDMAIVDDPQTPESARSPEQCRRRLSIVRSDVAGMGGPGRDIRIVVPCTIIENGDMADEITDVSLSPDFMGARHRFFESMPENLDAWNEYNDIRIEGLKARDKGRAAKRYYKDHRETLDAGIVVSWPERKDEHSVSGIQWGMNQFFRMGERAFRTELQNDPMPEEAIVHIKPAHVLNAATEFPRWVCPWEPIGTVAFIDCNPRTSGLHWSVISFGEMLSAHVVAYGRYPARGQMVPEGASEAEENQILFEGLRQVAASFADTKLPKGKIDLLMIDGGYKFAIVQMFIQNCRYPFEVFCSRGRSSGTYKDDTRDVKQAKQYIHLRQNKNREWYLSHNVDPLREIVYKAFMAGPGAPGGIGLHKPPPAHDEYAAQVASMRLTDKAEGATGPMYKWSMIPGCEDHWLDSVVGCFAGAHWRDIQNVGSLSARGPKPKRRYYSVPI